MSSAAPAAASPATFQASMMPSPLVEQEASLNGPPSSEEGGAAHAESAAEPSAAATFDEEDDDEAADDDHESVCVPTAAVAASSGDAAAAVKGDTNNDALSSSEASGVSVAEASPAAKMIAEPTTGEGHRAAPGDHPETTAAAVSCPQEAVPLVVANKEDAPVRASSARHAEKTDDDGGIDAAAAKRLARLRLECAATLEATCDKLREAFFRRLSAERERRDREWAATEARLCGELEARLAQAVSAAEARYKSGEARAALRRSAASTTTRGGAGPKGGGSSSSSRSASFLGLTPCGASLADAPIEGNTTAPPLPEEDHRDDHAMDSAAEDHDAAYYRAKLAERDAELDLAYATYAPTLDAQRAAQAKLVAARDAAVEVHTAATNNTPRRSSSVHARSGAGVGFPVKVMGVLDPVVLTRAGMNPLEISALQERVRHPDFYPARVVVNAETGAVTETVDRDHPELVALRYEYGEPVVDEVCRCFAELNEWNPSARYHVAVPWNADRDTELAPADVIRLLAARVAALEGEQAAAARRVHLVGAASAGSSPSSSSASGTTPAERSDEAQSRATAVDAPQAAAPSSSPHPAPSSSSSSAVSQLCSTMTHFDCTISSRRDVLRHYNS
mmetsp:Transcript_26767/g.107203  ORF Transcript_26767/g.107203 Transcript_26767/m.107203 type:complete len:621 (-) Transcript_26767:124-1986(-)